MDRSFAFVGYIPSTPAERVQRIKELESLALKTGQTQLLIETPYRNTALLQALLQTLQHNTRLATASGLTLPHAQCYSDLVKNWKHTRLDAGQRPAHGVCHRQVAFVNASRARCAQRASRLRQSTRQSA